MTGIDALGHLFYVTSIVGQLAIGRRHTWGWIARILGSLGWAVLGWQLELSSVVVWSFAFALVDARGWWLWRERI